MKKQQPELKILSLDITKSRDDFNFEQIIQLGEYKVRLDIRSNSYKFQCHARATVWQKDKLAWSYVVHIEPEAMKTPEGLVYHPNAYLGNFAKDADALIAKVKKVLF